MYRHQEDKDRNNKEYLRALKRDFDIIWEQYGYAHDDELKDEQHVKVKSELIDVLEKFFEDDKV